MISLDKKELEFIVKDSAMDASMLDIEVGTYEGGRMYYLENMDPDNMGKSLFSVYVTLFGAIRAVLRGECSEFPFCDGSAKEYLSLLKIDPDYASGNGDILPARAVKFNSFDFSGVDKSYHALLDCLREVFRGDLLVIPSGIGITTVNEHPIQKNDNGGCDAVGFLGELPPLITLGNVMKLM